MVLDLFIKLEIVSAIILSVGLFFNGWAILEINKTRQLQLLNDVFNSIKDTELLLYQDYAKADQKKIKEWDSLFFNSVERFSFLANERFINNRISRFFDEAIIKWYEEIFMQHFSKREREDRKIYPEFKRLYIKLKLNQQGKSN